MSYEKKEEKNPYVFPSTCWKSGMQHLGDSHKHLMDFFLCSVNKADHRISNGNRLPSSVYANTVGWWHNFLDILDFTHSRNCSLCAAGAGGQSDFILLCMSRTQCNWNVENTVQPLCIWRLGTLFTLLVTALHVLNQALSQVLTHVGSGIQHQWWWWMMQSVSPFLWLAALGSGVSHCWQLHLHRHQFMEKPVMVVQARGYSPEGTAAMGDLCWGRDTQETMAMDNPCQHCSHGWTMTEQWQ